MSAKDELLRLADSLKISTDDIRAIIGLLSAHGIKIPQDLFLLDDEGIDGPLCISDAWNEYCSHLHKVVALNTSRKMSMKQRWSEFPDKEKWREASKIISKSAFHNGENDRGWKANFDYFIRPMTIIKCLEGQFKSKDDLW